jgi:HK97 family phage portal protein
MRWFRKTEDRTLTFDHGGDFSPYTYGTGDFWSTGSISPECAMRVADVYSCIRCLADAAASVPLILYRRTANGRERVTGGRTVELLNRPGPATSQANLIGQAVAHLNAAGNAYFGKYKDADGQVVQLGLLDPDRVVVELKRGEPRYTLTSPQGLTTEHGTDDILHVRALSTDGLLGLSPIRQCQVAMRVAEGAGQFLDAYLAQGARPAGFIHIGDIGGSNSDTVEYLKESWRNSHGGVTRMHQLGVLSGGAEVKWIPVASTLGDAEFVEQRKLSTAEICRIFRVPPWMVGAPSGDSLTYSNVEQQQLAFVTHSLRPWLVLIEQAISNDRDLCRGPNLYCEFLLDGLLRADHATRADVYTKALNAETGWMTRAEARQLENLPAEDTAAERQPRPATAAVKGASPTGPPATAATTNGASNGSP